MKTSCRQTELRSLNCRKVPYWLSKVVVVMLVLKNAEEQLNTACVNVYFIANQFLIERCRRTLNYYQVRPRPHIGIYFWKSVRLFGFSRHWYWRVVGIACFMKQISSYSRDHLYQLLLLTSFTMTTSTSSFSLTKNILAWRQSPTSALCSMYDVDGNGWIDLLEMTKMVRSIYQVTK